MARRLLAVLALVLALGGCKLRADVGTEVERDGSGRLTVSIGFDEQLRQLVTASSKGRDPWAELERDARRSFGAGRAVKVSRWSDGDVQGVRVTVPFSSPEDLASLQGALQGGSGGPTARLSLRHDGHQFLFEATSTSSSASLSQLTGGLSPQPGTPQLTPEVLSSLIDLRVTAKLPGRLLEDNADQVDHGTLVWKLRLGERRTMRARSTTATPVLTAILAGVAGLLALGALGAGLWWWRRRRTTPAPRVYLGPGSLPTAPGTHQPTADPRLTHG